MIQQKTFYPTDTELQAVRMLYQEDGNQTEQGKPKEIACTQSTI